MDQDTEKSPGKGQGVSKRRIVIGYDGSQNAEDAFKWFVKKIHKRGDYVIIVHVPEFKNLSHVPVMTADAALMSKIVDEEQQKCKLMLAKINELMRISDVKGNIKQVMGDAGEQIVQAASKEGADFIVTGSRGLGKFRRTFLGSVSDYIVHHSTVPVIVCKIEDHLH
ncbi:Ubiquitin carboxyl-terminal hydrolase 22 [Mactra antiquata]